MPDQKQLDKVFINIAKEFSTLSKAERKKVGALLVKDGNVISIGYNGTPSGFDNCCEIDPQTTKPEVLHAETNAILKCARSTYSSEGSVLYLTYSPCFDCAKLVIQAGIKRVVYLEEYRDVSGLDLLRQADIKVEKFKE